MKKGFRFTWFLKLVLISLLLAFAAGCGSKDDRQQAKTAANVPGVTDSTILIGNWMPMSGPAAAYGSLAKGMDAYFKKVNDDGGIHGRKIKFIFEDDAYQPAKTVAIVKRMVEQDKVFAFVGGNGASHNVAVMDYMVQNNVPHIGPLTGANVITTPPKKGVFALQPSYFTEGYLKTKFVVENLKAKRIAALVQNDDAGKDGVVGARKYLDQKGLDYAVNLTFNSSDLDFTSYILKIKEANADVVSIGSVPRTIALFLKQAREHGLNVPIVSSSSATSAETIAMAGPSAEGHYFFSWLPLNDEIDNPKIKAHIEIFKKYYPNEQASGFTKAGQAYAELVVEGLKRAGKDLTREKLIEAMEGMKNWSDGLAHNVTYGPGLRDGQKSMFVVQVKNGKFVRCSDYLSVDK